MATAYVTGGKIVLTRKLSPGDTSLYADRDLGIDEGRLYFVNADQVEWIDFSGGVTASGSEFVYAALVRQLSTTADPATSTGTGYTWLAATEGKNVAMHDQLFDKQNPEPVVFATTAARDTALGANGAATKAWINVYVTATGLHYNYNLSTAQWEAIDTGTTTPNASATAAGKVEIATSAESIAGTDTGGTGAFVSVLPSDIAKNAQSGTFVYGADAGGDDTYVVALTPVLAAYTAGQKLTFTPTTANTGACTVDFGPGVLNIKTKDGNDPQTGVIRALKPVTGTRDGTSFILDSEDFSTTANKGTVEMATDAEAIAGSDEQRFVNPKQLVDVAGRVKVTSTSFSGNLSSFSLAIPHATYSKISVKFMITGGVYGYEDNTGILMFDNTNGKGSVVVVGRNNAADEGYGYAPRPASGTTSTWTGYSYDGLQNNVCTLKKGATYYEIDFTRSVNSGNTLYAIFDVSYST